MRERVRHAAAEDADALLSAEGPLDEAEQERVVRSLERDEERQQVVWRAVWGVLSLLIAGAFFALALRQFWSPWDLRHHAFFRGTLSSGWLVFVESSNGAAFLFLGWFVWAVRQTRWELLVPIYGLLQGWLLLKATKVQELGLGDGAWRFLWLPLAVPLHCLVIWVVRRELSSSRRDLERLKQHRYRHKGA